jgi:hypothetical protein
MGVKQMQTKIVSAVAAIVAVTGFAQAQQATALTSRPPDASAVTNWYRQNVYNPSEQKIGKISDVLVEKDGRIAAFIVSVGGFLGMGEKHVAVPFMLCGQRKGTQVVADNGCHQGTLKTAAGYKYDRAKATWEPA